MNESIINNAAKAAEGNIDTSTVIIIIFCVGWLFERIWKMTRHQRNGSPSWGDINTKLDKKVNGEDCRSFKTRIGKESDEHRQNISDIKEGIGAIKADIGYIKGKIC